MKYLETGITLANGISTTLSVTMNGGGAILGITLGGVDVTADSFLIPSGSTIATALLRLVAQQQGNTAGYVVWTKAEYVECERRRCCFICERNEFVLKEDGWRRCSPRISLAAGVLTTLGEAVSKAEECKVQHREFIQEVRDAN